MNRRIPAEFIPDEPAFIATPCPECGKPVAPPGTEPDHNGQVIYKHRDVGNTLLESLHVEDGNWHLGCAFLASPRVSETERRYCPDCRMASSLHPEGAAPDYRMCVECVDVRAMEPAPIGGEP